MPLRSLPLSALLTLAIAAPAQAGTLDYVSGAQNSDGGFGMTQSGGSSQLATGWALLGLNATGRRPGPAALGYVRRGLPSLRDIGDVERTVLVVRAAGQNPRRFGGRNLIADIMRHRNRDGSFDGYVSYTSFAIFALRRSASAATPARSGAPRGGWSATRTPTAASTSAAAGRAGSTTPAMPRRRWRRPVAAAPPCAAPPRSWPARRAHTAASRSAAAAPPTRSRRRTRCRGWWPRAGTRPRCGAATPTCAR